MRPLYHSKGLFHHSQVLPSSPTDFGGLAFSSRDFKAFLSDPENMFMMVECGGTVMLMMKTAATPELEQAATDQRIDELESEYRAAGGSFVLNSINFTKCACVEFGLVLYLATERGEVAERVDVTR